MATNTTVESKQPEKAIPDAKQSSKPEPDGKQPRRRLPQTGNPESTITLGDILIEIKPTKLKYQRNRTAMLYKLLDNYPLADILAMEPGAFGEGDDRDGDKAVFDWLVAVTDDEALVRAHYDEMDTDTVERLLAIFKRVNKVDEKEAHQKKLRAAATASLDRTVALIAAHLGVVDEDKINNMSYVFFEDVLSELGHKLHYDAVVNYAGNSFFEKSWQLIADSNPLNTKDPHAKGGNAASGLASFLGGADIKIIGG